MFLQKIKYKNHVIGIYQDDQDVESPREWDCFGTIVSRHRRYDISDRSAPSIPSNVETWEEYLEELRLRVADKIEIILPVYAYTKGGLRISTKPYGDRWDSAQIGFIYATRADMLRQQTFKRLTKKLKDEYTRQLEGEIEVMDKWLEGDFKGYVIDPTHDGDMEGIHEEWCGGFYEEDRAVEAGKEIIDGLAAFDEEQEFIDNIPKNELPKYVNHEWKYAYASLPRYKQRLKE
jgi:hypothetical protein